MMTPSALNGKTILITGGTSRLGECFVREALRLGAAVCFTWANAEAKAAELEKAGARGYRLDLADMRAIDAFADAFRKRASGPLHGLIHNAAAVSDKLLRDMEEADWDRVMAVDLKAPFYLTQKLLPLLSPGSARVLMLISRAAHLGAYGASNYAAAKAGLVALVKSLAQELGPSGVLVNAVNPGFMLSGMTAGLAQEYLDRNREASPLEKFSDPEEVARFLAYLCSDAVTQVTGQVFHFESRRIPF